MVLRLFLLSVCLSAKKTGLDSGPDSGADQNFGISTPPKIRCRLLSVLCNFLIQRTTRAPRVPRGLGRGENQNWGIFYRNDPPQNEILRTFVLFNFLNQHSTEALQTRLYPQKGARFQVC